MSDTERLALRRGILDTTTAAMMAARADLTVPVEERRRREREVWEAGKARLREMGVW